MQSAGSNFSMCFGIEIIQSVCLFAVNTKTVAWIDTKHSGITKNDPESVLSRFKSPILVLSERNHDISGFCFTADGHFTYVLSISCSCLDSFYNRVLLPKRHRRHFEIQTTTTNHYSAVWCSKYPFKHLQTPLVTTCENGNTVLKSITVLTVFSCLLSSFHSLATFLMLSSSHFCIKKYSSVSTEWLTYR